LPANITLTDGTSIFTATLLKAGNQTITAIDTTNPSIIGTSNNIAVSAGTAARFTLGAPFGTVAGLPISLTVTAFDAFNNIATGYSGLVHFTSTDGQASLPGNSPLTNGTGTFNATLRTAGTQTVTATDSVNSNLTAHANIQVSSNITTQFKVVGPTTKVAGDAFSITVAAEDAFNNATPS